MLIGARKAFSLLEILLAAIIFLISVAGIFATLNAVRGPVANKESQLAASVFGKQVLEALYSQVSDSQTTPSYYNTCASPCPNFDLSVGTHQVPHTTLSTVGNLTWPQTLVLSNTIPACDATGACLAYTVSCANNGSTSDPTCNNTPSSAHKVALSINWPSFP